MSVASAFSPFWLRGRTFDLWFILGIAGLSLLVAAVISHSTAYTVLIAQLNVLPLATPHFIATYTRIGFDRESAKKHFFLILPLPLLVIAGLSFLVSLTGTWIVASIYLYWQWWHFTRQSYGISRMYLSRAHNVYTPHPIFDKYGLYALPLCGLLYRSYQQPGTYLGMPIRTLPVSIELVWLAAAVAGALFVMQLLYWRKAWLAKILPGPYVLYVMTHYAVFLTGYLLISNLDFGWLMFNMWHNTQYIAFVWMYNNRRFKAGEIRPRTILADVSNGKTLWVYLIVLVVLGMLLNTAISLSVARATVIYALLPWFLIMGMSTAFHHYIVDSIIWKRKRRTVFA